MNEVDAKRTSAHAVIFPRCPVAQSQANGDLPELPAQRRAVGHRSRAARRKGGAFPRYGARAAAARNPHSRHGGARNH
jgi:hypothetical protein